MTTDQAADKNQTTGRPSELNLLTFHDMPGPRPDDASLTNTSERPGTSDDRNLSITDILSISTSSRKQSKNDSKLPTEIEFDDPFRVPPHRHESLPSEPQDRRSVDLKERQAPVAKDLKGVRSALEEADSFRRLKAEKMAFNYDRDKDQALVAVLAPTGDGRTLMVRATSLSGIYTARDEDSLYLLNRNIPELDTRIKAGAPEHSSIDWSKYPDLRRQMELMTTVAYSDLITHSGYLPLEGKQKNISLASTLVETAHKQKMIDDRSMASYLSDLGTLFTDHALMPAKGQEMKERALTLLTVETGASSPATMSARESLIAHYEKYGMPGSAVRHIKDQMDALAAADKAGAALDPDMRYPREQMVNRLLKAGKTADANKIMDRTLDALLSRPAEFPLTNVNAAGVSTELLNYYLENGKPADKVEKLLDRKFAEYQLAKKTGANTERDRTRLIDWYAAAGKSDRVEQLLQEQEREIEDSGTNGKLNPQKLEDARIDLAASYLKHGRVDKAREVSDRALSDAAKNPTEKESDHQLEKRLSLATKLREIADPKALKAFNKETLELFEKYARSEDALKNPKTLARYRKDLIEHHATKDEPKVKQSLLEAQIKWERANEDEAAVEIYSFKLGALHLAQGNRKEADGLFHYLVAEKSTPEAKSRVLRSVVEAYEDAGIKDEAEKARRDLDAIGLRLPPKTYTSGPPVKLVKP